METSSISRSKVCVCECECVLYTTGKTHQVAWVRRMAVVSVVCRNVYAPPPRLSQTLRRSLWGPQSLQTIDVVYSRLSLKWPLRELACVSLLCPHVKVTSVCSFPCAFWFVWQCVYTLFAISQWIKEAFFEQWAAQRKHRGFQMVWQGRCLTWTAWLLFLSNLWQAGNTLWKEPGGLPGGKLSV